eukprot:TRINITY_DN4351_c0_g1_i7.p1 TRINITY_DN4351_c0_g1~~TRINITY_DN4351_c0_g1_i7.p1  ORF type:complete len:535 (+),score=123.96 TRINITY_DN4351_c0_g1_i7:180-1784(+)
MKQRDNVRSGCTFLLPSGTTGYQHFYHCNECYGDKSIKVCGFCIETCHKGHRRNHSSSLSSSSSQEKTKQTGKCGCGELGCITNAYVDSSDLSDSFLVFVYSDMEQDPQKPFQYPLGIDQEKIFFFRRASTIFRQADQGRGYLTPKLFREGLSKFEHLLPNYGSLDTSHAAFTSTVSNDKVKNPLDLLFKAIDKTGSGKITEREFAEFYVFEKIRTLDSTVNRCPLQYAIEKGLFQEQLSLEQSQVEDSKVGGSDSVGSRESVHGDDGSVNRTGVKGVVGVGRIGRAKGSVSKTDRDRNVGGGGDRENLHGEKENTSPQTWKKITPGKSRQVSEVLDSCRKMLEELKSFNPSDLVFGMSNLEATESVLSKTLESIKLEKIKPTLSTTINWIGFFVSNGVKYNVETTMCWKNGIIDGPVDLIFFPSVPPPFPSPFTPSPSSLSSLPSVSFLFLLTNLFRNSNRMIHGEPTRGGEAMTALEEHNSKKYILKEIRSTWKENSTSFPSVENGRLNNWECPELFFYPVKIKSKKKEALL